MNLTRTISEPTAEPELLFYLRPDVFISTLIIGFARAPLRSGAKALQTRGLKFAGNRSGVLLPPQRALPADR